MELENEVRKLVLCAVLTHACGSRLTKYSPQATHRLLADKRFVNSKQYEL
jgi:hypothetical protein